MNYRYLVTRDIFFLADLQIPSNGSNYNTRIVPGVSNHVNSRFLGSWIPRLLLWQSDNRSSQLLRENKSSGVLKLYGKLPQNLGWGHSSHSKARTSRGEPGSTKCHSLSCSSFFTFPLLFLPMKRGVNEEI